MADPEKTPGVSPNPYAPGTENYAHTEEDRQNILRSLAETAQTLSPENAEAFIESLDDNTAQEVANILIPPEEAPWIGPGSLQPEQLDEGPLRRTGEDMPPPAFSGPSDLSIPPDLSEPPGSPGMPVDGALGGPLVEMAPGGISRVNAETIARRGQRLSPEGMLQTFVPGGGGGGPKYEVGISTKETAIPSPELQEAAQAATNRQQLLILQSGARQHKDAEETYALMQESVKQGMGDVRALEHLTEQQFEALGRRVQSLQDQIKEVSSRKVDPNRVFSNAGTLGTIGAALAIGFGTYHQALYGGENTPLNIINSAIQRDIEAQVADINNAQQGVQASSNLLNQQFAIFRNHQDAVSSAMAIQQRFAATRLEALAVRHGGAAAKDAAVQLVADLKAKSIQNQMAAISSQVVREINIKQEGRGNVPHVPSMAEIQMNAHQEAAEQRLSQEASQATDVYRQLIEEDRGEELDEFLGSLPPEVIERMQRGPRPAPRQRKQPSSGIARARGMAGVAARGAGRWVTEPPDKQKAFQEEIGTSRVIPSGAVEFALEDHVKFKRSMEKYPTEHGPPAKHLAATGAAIQKLYDLRNSLDLYRGVPLSDVKSRLTADKAHIIADLAGSGAINTGVLNEHDIVFLNDFSGAEDATSFVSLKSNVMAGTTRAIETLKRLTQRISDLHGFKSRVLPERPAEHFRTGPGASPGGS